MFSGTVRDVKADGREEAAGRAAEEPDDTDADESGLLSGEANVVRDGGAGERERAAILTKDSPEEAAAGLKQLRAAVGAVPERAWPRDNS